MNSIALSLLRTAAAAPTLALAALLGTAGSAQAGPWTSTAATCTPDEASVGTALMSAQTVTVSPPEALPRTVRLRCNVTDVFARQGFAGPVKLGARFVDNGNDAAVVLQLFEHDFATGAVRLLLTLNSDTLTASSVPQVHSVSAGCLFSLNFNRSAYWVEAALTRRTAAGTPALHQVRLVDELLC